MTTAEAKKVEEIPRDPVPMRLWGKDHWSTFAYLETRCVDQEGMPGRQQMRCDADRHPHHAHLHELDMDHKKYPTMLKDRAELHNHDDWDCVDDMEAAGLVETLGTGLHPIWRLTTLGIEIASELRGWKALGGDFSAFVWPLPPRTTEKTDGTISED